jgi:hypothetical protein
MDLPRFRYSFPFTFLCAERDRCGGRVQAAIVEGSLAQMFYLVKCAFGGSMAAAKSWAVVMNDDVLG